MNTPVIVLLAFLGSMLVLLKIFFIACAFQDGEGWEAIGCEVLKISLLVIFALHIR